MSRYIDADKLKQAIEEKQRGAYGDYYPNYLLQMVDDQPTVNAIQVVRCKDCNHGKYDPKRDAVYCCLYREYGRKTYFCQNGIEKLREVTE